MAAGRRRPSSSPCAKLGRQRRRSDYARLLFPKSNFAANIRPIENIAHHDILLEEPARLRPKSLIYASASTLRAAWAFHLE